MHDDPPLPLIVTSDSALLDDMLRVAAAAGVEPEVVTDVTAARRPWQTAPMVALGADVATDIQRARLAARSGVVLVGRGDADASVWRTGVELGAAGVVCLPGDEGDLSRRFVDAAEGGAAAGPVVCVVGSCGGSGASTVAVGLALAAVRRRLRATLVDADPCGGGLDLLLGGENVAGLRWSALTASRGRIRGVALHAALPEMHGVRVLSCDGACAPELPADAMAAVLDACRRVSDVVVVDASRYLDNAANVALGAATVVLVVVPAQVRAVAAADRVTGPLRQLAPNAQVLIRSGGYPNLSPGFVAGHLDLPVAGVFASERAVDAAIQRGEPPGRSRRGHLARLCNSLIADLVMATP